MSAEANKLQSDHFALGEKYLGERYYEQLIRIYPGQYSASNEAVLANAKIFERKYPGLSDYELILTAGAMSDSLSADKAQEKCTALNAAGIKARIYSKKVDERVSRNVQKEVSDNFSENKNTKAKDYIFFKDHTSFNEVCGTIGGILLVLGLIFAPGGQMISDLNISYAGYIMLAIAGVLFLSMIVTAVCDKIYGARIKNKYAKEQSEREAIIDNAKQYEIAVKEYYYEVMDAIQAEVMVDVYTWKQMTYDAINKVRAEIEERKRANKQIYANATAYIPANVPRWLLLKAAEIMDKNRSVGLNTAIAVVRQSGYINVATENYSEFKTAMLGYLAEIPEMKRRLG